MTPRARHGRRERCSDPEEVGCRNFARRHSVPPTCPDCGGGTRAEIKHLPDGTRQQRGVVSVGPRVQALLDGTLDISELDDEELARGYPRSKNGTFQGNRPKVIPTMMYNRMRKELFDRADTKLRSGLMDAATLMTNVINNDKVDPKVRMDAAKWVFERMMGKTPDRIEFGADSPFMDLLEKIQRGPAPEPEPVIIEGEVADDRF